MENNDYDTALPAEIAANADIFSNRCLHNDARHTVRHIQGNPLQEILVMCSVEIQPLCVVDAKVIGIMHMEDENGLDDKILSVAAHDPAYHHINDLKDIPQHHIMN